MRHVSKVARNGRGKGRAKQPAPAQAKVAPARGRRTLGSPSGRGELLKAALREFARHGFEATSIRTLGREAQVDMALIARLFGSKSQLWVAVVDRLAERQLAHLEQLRVIAADAQHAPASALRRLIHLLAQISFEIPEFPAFLLQEATDPGDRLRLLQQRLVQPFTAHCMPIIESAVAAGVVRATDPAVFFGMLLSAVSLPMTAPLVFLGAKTATAELRDRVAEQALLAFMAPD